MSKKIYISADYALDDGEREVVDILHIWGKDNKHKTYFIDTAQVSSGSISKDPDCRPCDLKAEFNSQINASSVVIIAVGDKTAIRTAGNSSKRNNDGEGCDCTPYKQNAKGVGVCKIYGELVTPEADEDVGNINSFLYLRHEFEQAKKKNKTIIIVYNSLNKQPSWLPWYLSDFEDDAYPFWKKDRWGNKVGDYQYIKEALGYE